MTEYAVVNPATGETLATYPTITDDALEAVIEKADAAYRTWRDTPVAERAALVRRVAELHRERRDELAAIIVREMGKPLAAAYGEVDFAADITEYYADNAEKITGDQPHRHPRRGHRGHPPLADRRAARDHAVELPVLPGRALRRAEPRDRQHDHPEARLAVPRVRGRDRADATSMPASPRARTSTSTRPTSRRRPSSPTRACRASRSPDRSAPVPRSPRSPGATSRRSRSSSADRTRSSCCRPTTSTAAVNAAVEARMDNNGQSLQRAEAFHRRRRPVRRPSSRSSRRRWRRRRWATRSPRTPCSDPSRRCPRPSGCRSRSTRRSRRARRLVTGGTRDGAFYAPTVLTDVTSDMDVYREELFGPAGVVYKVADEDEAVKIANDTDLRARLVRLHHRRGAGRSGRRQDRRRHGLRQRRARGLARAALRRREALRHLARDGPAGGGRVRQQEAHPRRRLKEARASAIASSAHATCWGVPQRVAASLLASNSVMASS